MKKQNGFTLVELAIALMVIGLLIGGVLKGQELIENAKVTSVMRQLKAYDTATMIFRNTYGALPGDIKRPTRIPNCTAAICNQGGNGNGKIGLYTDSNDAIERGNYFPHLTKAGMIQGPEGIDDLATIDDNVDRVYPETPWSYTIGMRYDSHPNGSLIHVYVLPEYINDDTESIPAKAMVALDEKMDDGKPFTGNIWITEINICPYSGNEYDTSIQPEGCRLIVQAGF